MYFGVRKFSVLNFAGLRLHPPSLVSIFYIKNSRNVNRLCDKNVQPENDLQIRNFFPMMDEPAMRSCLCGQNGKRGSVCGGMDIVLGRGSRRNSGDKAKTPAPGWEGAVRRKNQIAADLPRIFFKVLISRGISNSIITTQPQKFDHARAEKLFFMMLIKI